MKKILTRVAKIILVLALIGLAGFVLVFGIRNYNDIKYRPDGYKAEDTLDPKDLSLYETDLEGIRVTRVQGEYMNGFRLEPEVKSHRGVIVTFGGSEGSPNYGMAKRLAGEGYEVLALFFFGMENQQMELVHIPLEFFQEVLAYIGENIEDGDVISLYGGSKGAELALNLAVIYPEIDNVILHAPTAWNYMGLSQDYSRGYRSSWTYQGKELAFIDITKGDGSTGFNLFLDYLLNRPITYRPAYETAAINDPKAEEARIKVENTDANILIIAGSQDKMWQSEVSAKAIEEKRPENTEVHIYEDAGHIFSMGGVFYSPGMILAMGGDEEANSQAGRESNKILLQRLEEWHR